MLCHLRSLYLCVSDMARAIRFYEALLEMPVTVRDAVYSVFDIDGFRLGLFANATQNEPHTLGTSCVPSIDVPDLATLRQTLCGREIAFPLTQIGQNWVAEIVDSEGNRLELTAPL